MKRSILMLLALTLIGCGQQDNGDKVAVESVVVDTTTLREAAVGMIDQFAGELKQELMAVMKEDGPAAAIGVCQIKAPEIEAACRTEDWSVTRVTDRPRNQDNSADAEQLEVLYQFADADASPDYIESIVEETAGQSYRYYKPIRIMGLCLNCHGTSEKIDPGVAELLKETYPEDKATGYSNGELRGMFVVEINLPLPEEARVDLNSFLPE